MTNSRTKGGKKRKPKKAKRAMTAGSFRPGFDPRRHLFTKAERQLGYQRCLEGHGRCRDPEVCAWVWRKVRSFYRARKEGHYAPQEAAG